ncbi:glycosyltransferase family 2 protein [Parahaliea mediterranea]|uniref:glycosyltransferase family 2 protein n=1 Tax=Parahaliea mediterranea TaxID=651086 RepID=UPI001F4D399D
MYNHPAVLPELVATLRRHQLPVILVNDGSNAACSALLRELAGGDSAVTLVEHPRNRGKGGAVKSGLRAAARGGFTHVLQIDADGQHNTDDIEHLLTLARRHPDALVAAVPRYDNAPALRYYGRYLTHVWVWIHTLSLDISDALCGFRVYPLAATLAIIDCDHTGDRMDFDPEILVRLHWAGVPVVELPSRVCYPADGVSHFRGLHDNALISWAHTRLFFGMLRRLPQLLWRRVAGGQRRQNPAPEQQVSEQHTPAQHTNAKQAPHD